MLKYSITALALVAGSTFALADPNPGGANGPGSSGGAAMERSGGGERSGGSMSGGTAKGDGGALKGDRESGPGSAGAPSRSSESYAKPDRQAKDNEGSAKSNKREAQDSDRNLKGENRQAKDNDRNLKNSDRAERNERGERNERAERNDRDRNERMGADQSRDKTKADRSSTGASEGVEGKGGAKGSITNITTEQRTQVKSVFLSHRVEPARVNIAINVGVRVPRSVHFYPIPEDIVTIVPDYRGYEYFMIDESHVAIVDPDTLEVVDIIVVA